MDHTQPLSREHELGPPPRGAPLAGHWAQRSLLMSKMGAQTTLPRARGQLTQGWIPGGPFVCHRLLRPLHPYYHGKLGKGEGQEAGWLLEEKDLNKWVEFRDIKVRGTWNYCDISYFFQIF